jgi:hypothetical protein
VVEGEKLETLDVADDIGPALDDRTGQDHDDIQQAFQQKRGHEGTGGPALYIVAAYDRET